MNTLQVETQTPGVARSQRIGGILLAAGAGKRMGNRPKCLLQLDGESLLACQLNALSQAGVSELWVVLGHYAKRIQQEVCLSRWSVRTVHNPQPDVGHVGSLRVGLRALAPGLDVVLVALADQPLINTQDVADLLCAFASRPAGTDMLQPFVRGLPGNPVAVMVTFAAFVRPALQRLMGSNDTQELHRRQHLLHFRIGAIGVERHPWMG